MLPPPQSTAIPHSRHHLNVAVVSYSRVQGGCVSSLQLLLIKSLLYQPFTPRGSVNHGVWIHFAPSTCSSTPPPPTARTHMRPCAMFLVRPTTVVTLMKKPCNTFLVAEETKDDDSKSVVGCVHVCWSGETDSDDGDVDAHFGMLSVAKGCSGRGIGKLLVSAAGVSRVKPIYFPTGRVCPLRL